MGLTRIALALTVVVPHGALGAQAITTATISGTVRNEEGRAMSRVEVVVTSLATGVTTRGRTRDDGRYTISGLEVGGPYSVAIHQIGYLAQTRDGLRLTIGQNLVFDAGLTRVAVLLQGVRSEARPNDARSRTLGVGTFLSDSALHRLPTADRDIYGFVRLVPQISTWYGLSAAGASPRMNGVLLDGASEQGLYGGVPGGGVYGGKTTALDAVKEYQVLLSPYDVRHGNFAGAEINAVTRSGTNELHGSAFYYGRYEALSRNVPFFRDASYERTQAGFSLGGLLALRLARLRPTQVAALAVMAAPLRLRPYQARAVRLLARLPALLRRGPFDVLPKLRGYDIVDQEMAAIGKGEAAQSPHHLRIQNTALGAGRNRSVRHRSDHAARERDERPRVASPDARPASERRWRQGSDSGGGA